MSSVLRLDISRLVIYIFVVERPIYHDACSMVVEDHSEDRPPAKQFIRDSKTLEADYLDPTHLQRSPNFEHRLRKSCSDVGSPSGAGRRTCYGTSGLHSTSVFGLACLQRVIFATNISTTSQSSLATMPHTLQHRLFHHLRILHTDILTLSTRSPITVTETTPHVASRASTCTPHSALSAPTAPPFSRPYLVVAVSASSHLSSLSAATCAGTPLKKSVRSSPASKK